MAYLKIRGIFRFQDDKIKVLDIFMYERMKTAKSILSMIMTKQLKTNQVHAKSFSFLYAKYQTFFMNTDFSSNFVFFTN